MTDNVINKSVAAGSTELITEREKLEFESVPEFVREPRTSARDSYAANKAPATPAAPSKPLAPFAQAKALLDAEEPVADSGAALPKSAELEALWPGVSHHEFFHHSTPKKGPSFYLCIGFMAGAVVSMIGITGYSWVTHLASNTNQGKEIVVAQGNVRQGAADGRGGLTTTTNGEPAVIIPLAQVYEVGSGDTLAGIALKNYKRATPRLLDEICKANNMRNANVLSLGQKLALPEYHPQTRQIATGANSVQQ